MIEEFRDVIGYEGLYRVSNLGRVINRKNHELHQTPQSSGRYMNISLCSNGYVRTFRVHRLVAEAFLPNKKEQVNHIDGNALNNCVDNLEWVTRSQNALHSIHVLGNPPPPAYFHGKFGKEHNRSKSFWVKTIDDNIKEYGSGLEFMRDTGISHTVISMARKQMIIKDMEQYSFKRGMAKGMVLFLSNPHFQLKEA